jgi:hypothetical protein
MYLPRTIEKGRAQIWHGKFVTGVTRKHNTYRWSYQRNNTDMVIQDQVNSANMVIVRNVA